MFDETSANTLYINLSNFKIFQQVRQQGLENLAIQETFAKDGRRKAWWQLKSVQ